MDWQEHREREGEEEVEVEGLYAEMSKGRVDSASD